MTTTRSGDDSRRRPSLSSKPGMCGETSAKGWSISLERVAMQPLKIAVGIRLLTDEKANIGEIFPMFQDNPGAAHMIQSVFAQPTIRYLPAAPGSQPRRTPLWPRREPASPEFAEFHQALRSWVAGAAKAWQISEADLAGMMSFTEDEEMYERAKELRDQVHRDGVRQGLEQGHIRQRALLVRRFATRKFGAETAERLTRILEDRADADRLDEVVDAIIDCDSGAELFARVRA